MVCLFEEIGTFVTCTIKGQHWLNTVRVRKTHLEIFNFVKDAAKLMNNEFGGDLLPSFVREKKEFMREGEGPYRR